jgi:hypothetical protein
LIVGFCRRLTPSRKGVCVGWQHDRKAVEVTVAGSREAIESGPERTLEDVYGGSQFPSL